MILDSEEQRERLLELVKDDPKMTLLVEIASVWSADERDLLTAYRDWSINHPTHRPPWVPSNM